MNGLYDFASACQQYQQLLEQFTTKFAVPLKRKLAEDQYLPGASFELDEDNTATGLLKAFGERFNVDFRCFMHDAQLFGVISICLPGTMRLEPLVLWRVFINSAGSAKSELASPFRESLQDSTFIKKTLNAVTGAYSEFVAEKFTTNKS